jgi:hypothetical protein
LRAAKLLKNSGNNRPRGRPIVAAIINNGILYIAYSFVSDTSASFSFSSEKADEKHSYK